MKPALILHIGAHRTGTTTMQAALDAGEHVLTSKGIAVLTPPRPDKRQKNTVRKLVSLAGSARRPMGKALIWFKRKQAKTILQTLLTTPSLESTQSNKIILSDEKMLGSIFARDGSSIYPNSKSHLQALKKILPLDASEIHLTLRSYETFIVSSYVMRAVYGSKIKPFDAIANKLIAISRSWLDVVNDVQSVFPKSKLIISIFEENDFDQRLRSLIDDPQDRLNISDFIPPPMNRAPTLEAINYVQQLEHKPKNPDEIVERFAEGKNFDPLSDQQKHTLRQRYEQDVTTLRTRKDLVWV